MNEESKGPSATNGKRAPGAHAHGARRSAVLADEVPSSCQKKQMVADADETQQVPSSWQKKWMLADETQPGWMLADETQPGAHTHVAPDEVPSSQQNVVADETQTGSARMAPDKVPSSWQKMVADETQTGSAQMAPDEVLSSWQK